MRCVPAQPHRGVFLLALLALPLTLGAADVRTDKDVYYVLDPITVTFSGMPGNSDDWISIAKASHTAREYIQYFTTGGKTSGTLSFRAITDPGDYVVRAYYKNGYDIQAQRTFRVIFPTPQMSTDKSRYLVLEPVTVSYSGLPGFPDDYITIVPASAPDGEWWEYYKTGGAKSGTMKFTRQLDPGQYQVRLKYRNEDAIVRLRIGFTVEFPNTQVRTDKTAYLVNEKVVVTYSGMPGYPDDYITIVPASAPDKEWWEYYKTAGAKSGTMTFSRALEPGRYEARVKYRNEDGVVRTRAAFTVAFPNTQVRTDKTSYEVGEKIVVTYTDMPGYGDDYITIVPASSPDNAYWEWYRSAGAKSGTMTFTRKLDPGQYEARVHYRNEEAVVRARARFAVGAAACAFTLSPASASVGASGGSGTFSLTASAADCTWTAGSSDTAWLTVSPGSGTGNATLRYTAAANTATSARTGTIAVSGQTFTLTQAGSGGGAGVKLERYVLTKTKPGPCSEASVNPPAGVTTLAATDTSAYLWFYVTGAKKGDIAASEYYTPAGKLYPDTSGAWDPNESDGNFCFTDTPFKVAGAAPASLPGVWTIKVKYNGAELFTLTFTITGSGGAATGNNLVRNPGAEENSATTDCVTPGSIPGWKINAPVSVCRYGGEFPASAPGPADRGSNYFAGGPSNAFGSMTQTVDLSGNASAIDAGTLAYALSAWLGGWDGQDDNATVKAAFKNASGSALGSAVTLGPVLSADRKGVTGIWQRTANGTVPAGARSVDITVEFNRTSGSWNDSYADNISLALGGDAAPPVCTYSIAASNAPASASGGTGSIPVTAGAGCSWTAVSNVSWITVTSGASGTGSGSVAYSVAANSASTTRTGTLTVAGQTFTVTQAGAGCSYAISHTQTNVKAAGGGGSVLVTATAGCAWTSSTSAAWITITSGTSGSGNGTVAYSVAANTGAARSGALIIAGRTFTINQEASQEQPLIARGGVLNAASLMPADLPGGGIAQGAIFTILGERLGPEQSVSSSAYPIAARLAEVGVTVTRGSTVLEAYPLMVSATQINAILPSNTPLGDAQVTVTYRGKTSEPAAMKVVTSNFAPFGVSKGRGPGTIYNYVSEGNQPLNTSANTARPGQRAIMQGTGLGAIPAADNLAPPTGELPAAVEVYVAHKPARKIWAGRATAVPAGMAGVDQIVFELPADTPPGCYVPVQVKNGTAGYSNVVTMAVEPEGKACSDTVNPFAEINTKGRKGGSIFLLRANALAPLEKDKPPADITLDVGIGVFQESAPGGEQGYNPLFALPPVGTCTSYTGALDAASLTGGSSSSQASARALAGRIRLRQRAAAQRKAAADPLLSKELDAGASLTVTPPAGSAMPLEHADTETKTGPYMGLLGGTVPVEDGPALPLFLNPGTFTVTGPGGKDVGAFSATVKIPPPVNWTNRDSIAEVNRASDLTLTWSGGSADALVIIGGFGSDQKTSGSGGFFCFVPSEPGRFTVPSSVMGNMPATGTDLQESAGALIVGTAPLTYTKFTATGLDSGLLFSGALNVKMVPVK